jgi:hypothetical protein
MHFSHPLKFKDTTVVVAMFLVIALNVIANVSRNICNTVLELLAVLIEISFLRGKETLTKEEEKILNSFPKDVRGVRKAFDIKPKTIVYASCRVCSSIYPPKDLPGGGTWYPATCTYKRYTTSKECGYRLIQSGVYKKKSVRVPLIPYAMQDFGSFLGRLYSRAGIEDVIESTQRTLLRRKAELWDVGDGSAVGELRDASGRQFLRPDADDELRTVWCVSYDGFNPFHNKIAGKVASVGCLAFACLSLPPSLRYLVENLYPASLIPTSSNGDRLNHPLVPVVKDLQASYDHGRWFTRTFNRPDGRRSREAVVQVVADLLAAKKMLGAASHSAIRFCSLCAITKKDINNIDHKNHNVWRPITCEEYKAAAIEWRDATNRKRRAELYQKNGIRWSEWLRLSYFDPTRFVVIDGMHTLLLGLIRHHFRVILGMDIPVREEDEYDEEDKPRRYERPPTITEMEKARKTSRTYSQLHRLRIPVLRALCDELVVGEIQQTRKCPRKKDFIYAILVSHYQCLRTAGYEFLPSDWPGRGKRG